MNEHSRPSCPDDETLAALAEGGLDARRRADAEAHLAECAACRGALKDLAWALEDGPAWVAPEGLADRILARLPREDAPHAFPSAETAVGGRMLRFLPYAIAIAATFLVALGLNVWMGDPAPTPHGDPGGSITNLPLAAAAGASDVVPPPRPADLGGAARPLAHLQTDKPLYRPGEALFARAVLLDAFTHRPFDGAATGIFQVRSGRGEILHTASGALADGVAAVRWDLPADLAGGRYTLTAGFPDLGLPTTEIELDVRAYRVPRLRTDVQFLRKAYGPGDEAVATLEATRAEGGVPAGAKVTAIARVDGAEVHRATLALDGRGRATTRFRLPAAIAEGQGTLAFVIRDGGVQETAAKTIPIVLAKVDLAFHPEGGDLVAGLPCGLYLQARDARGEPADVAGRVVDVAGRQVVAFRTQHEGRGYCVLVPRPGMAYRAVLDEPAGIATAFALPAVRADGFALHAYEGAFPSSGPIEIGVASTRGTAATVGLYVRERELDLQAVRLEAGQPARVLLVPREDVHGVLRVTVFDAQGEPRAERLVFRRPPPGLKVELVPRAARTTPGGTVEVAVRTLDALGRPVSAVLGVVASDDAVLATVEPRERAPRLPVQALLGTEVEELKDAGAYLGKDAHAVDLLLGTQGWRRFAYLDPQPFLAAHGEKGCRALAQRVPPVPPTPDESGPWVAWEGAPPAGAVEPGAAAVDNAGAAGPDPRALAQARLLAAEQQPLELGAPAVVEPALERLVAGKPREEGREEAGFLRAPARPRDAAATRVYAHRAEPGRPAGARSDFTETVYWNAALKTDADGRGTIAFDAADAITTLRVRVDGFTADGLLGATDATIEVVRPFHVEPTMPLEVSAGDRIELPVAFVNATSASLPVTLRIESRGGLVADAADLATFDLPPEGSVRRLVPLRVGDRPGTAWVRLRASAGPYGDDVTREVQVVAAGFPIIQDFGGVLERIVEHEIVVPDDALPGSVGTETAVYPTPLATLTQALEALLREPNGCFEQTSSTNYPNVMALQYMETHQGVDPALVKRARDLLDRGYRKLVSFECRERGYEWFGADPGHEALTAYGVLEFHDMAQVMAVDAGMLQRTRAWLLGRRDGEGGFERSPRALDGFGSAPKDVTDAYILWALVTAGERGLEREIAALETTAARSEDAYVLALAANVLWTAGKREAARGLMTRLLERQAEGGAVLGARTSITRSGGESLAIETTALSILAWLHVPEHTRAVEAAMRWLAERCEAGRFGSTQATVLALKAITAYDAEHARPKRPGTVTLFLDGQPLHEVTFPADQQAPILLPDLAETLGSGRHVVRLVMEGGADMPYAFRLRYHALTPAASKDAPVLVRTRCDRAEVGEGETVEVRVGVRSTSDEGQPMAVAVVGLPGGLEARAAHLQDLVKAGTVDAVETRGREVILYWRSLAPRAEHLFTIDCVATVPGTWTGPASRAYLYYTDERKDWTAGLRVRVRGR